LPFFLIFLILFLAYRVLPNTKVKASPAIIGAIVATVLFSFARWGFGLYVTKYAHFNRIYGILGTLPAFLMWVYISWVIVLFGAEVTFTFQYHRLEREEKTVVPGDPTYSLYYAIRALLALRDHFQSGKGPLSVIELANSLNVAYGLMDEILLKLREARFVASVDEAREQFLPARDLEQVTLQEVVEAIKAETLVVASSPGDRQREKIASIFEKASEAKDRILGHTTIKDIVTTGD
jgi:membrane protein